MTNETTELVLEQLAIIKDLLKEDYSDFAKIAGNISKVLKTGNTEIMAVAADLLQAFAGQIEDFDQMAHGLALASAKLVTLP